MKSSFRLIRVAGIEIGIHYTWIFIFILITWSLAQGFFPQSYPGWSTTVYWLTGIISALLLFVSVIFHELAHSLVARSRGLPVHSITLFILGGVSNLEEEPKKPKVEFTMAVAGPLASLVLAGIYWALLTIVPEKNGPVAASLYYLALINAILAGFNLLPAFPLDGGRVLRSILWGTSGNLTKATEIATTAGRVFGWMFIIFGLFSLLQGNILGGLWITFIGWFLISSADASRRQTTLNEHLSGLKIRDVMYVGPSTITPETKVDEVIRDIFRQHHRRAVPICRNNKLVGIVTITDVKDLPQDKWPYTTVEQIMTREPLYSVEPGDDVSLAMNLIAKHNINQVLVLHDGQCVGVIGRADIINQLQLSNELRIGRKFA